MAVLAAATLFTSCWDTMDDKASIDAAYNSESQITSTGVTLTSATVKSYKRIDLVGSVSNLENVTEMGFMVGENPDMSGAQAFDATDYSIITVNPAESGWFEEVATEVIVTEEEAKDRDDVQVGETKEGETYYYYLTYSYVPTEDTEIDPNKSYYYDAEGYSPVSPVKEGWYVENSSGVYKLSTDTAIDPDTDYFTKSLPSNFAASATTLTGNTTYYVCAYAVTPSGIAISEVQQLQTPETPIYGIDGYYVTKEYLLDEDYWETWSTDGSAYIVYIESDPSDETAVSIYNLFALSDIFGGDECIDAIYEPDEGVIYIPSGSATGYSYGSYGSIIVRGVNSSVSAYTSYIEMAFTPRGGFITTTPCFMAVSAGRLSDYTYFEMEHLSDEEVAELLSGAKKRTYAPFTSKSFNLR